MLYQICLHLAETGSSTVVSCSDQSGHILTDPIYQFNSPRFVKTLVKKCLELANQGHAEAVLVLSKIYPETVTKKLYPFVDTRGEIYKETQWTAFKLDFAKECFVDTSLTLTCQVRALQTCI